MRWSHHNCVFNWHLLKERKHFHRKIYPSIHHVVPHDHVHSGLKLHDTFPCNFQQKPSRQLPESLQCLSPPPPTKGTPCPLHFCFCWMCIKGNANTCFLPYSPAALASLSALHCACAFIWQQAIASPFIFRRHGPLDRLLSPSLSATMRYYSRPSVVSPWASDSLASIRSHIDQHWPN